MKPYNKQQQNNHLFIAKNHLQLAISNKNSEIPIRNYIKFMDTLNKTEKEIILLNPGITKLIDIINRYSLG